MDEFVALASHVELSKEDQVSMFVEGMKGNNRKLIILGKTLTTEEDHYGGDNKKGDKSFWFNRAGNGPGNRGWQNTQTPRVTPQGQTQGKTMENWKAPITNNTRATPYQPPHKRICPNEMEEKRSKGLCFWGDKKYIFNHKCPNRRIYALIMEPIEGEEDESEGGVETGEQRDPDPIISLHGAC